MAVAVVVAAGVDGVLVLVLVLVLTLVAVQDGSSCGTVSVDKVECGVVSGERNESRLGGWDAVR